MQHVLVHEYSALPGETARRPWGPRHVADDGDDETACGDPTETLTVVPGVAWRRVRAADRCPACAQIVS